MQYNSQISTIVSIVNIVDHSLNTPLYSDNAEGCNIGPWCTPRVINLWWELWAKGMEKLLGGSENGHIKARIHPLCATCWANYSGDRTPHISVYVCVRMCAWEGGWTDVFYSLINIRKSCSDWRSWTKGALFLIGGLSPFTRAHWPL